MVTHNPNDPPRDPDGRFRTDDRYRDEKARKSASLATVLAAVAGVIAIVALIYAFVHGHDLGDSAPANCDPATDYVCEPETVEETATVDVPTTSMSPTEVPVPSTTQSEIVTTTVRP